MRGLLRRLNPSRLMRLRSRRVLGALAMLVPAGAIAGAVLLGCTQPQAPLSAEIYQADRERDWGLVYYQSWQKERNRDYLVMSRQRTQESVRLYLDVQRRMGYAYPTFYVVDRRRMASCFFLRQLQLEAASFAVTLDDMARPGCFDR